MISNIIHNCEISSQNIHKNEKSINKILIDTSKDKSQENFKGFSTNYLKEEDINKISDSSKDKSNIFFIRKEKKKNNKRRHGANSKDNIMQTIIRDFINFLIMFINLVLKQKKIKEKAKIEDIKNQKMIKINLEEMQLKIGYKIKETIKVNDILNLTVEKMLLLDELENRKIQIDEQRNNSTDNIEIINTNTNKHRIKILRIFYDSSLDIFFKTPVISLFKDIYIKNKKKINLTIYGIQGIILKMPKYIPSFQKLIKKEKDRNRDKEKIIIMNSLIESKFLNPKRKKRKIIKFKTTKKIDE